MVNGNWDIYDEIYGPGQEEREEAVSEISAEKTEGEKFHEELKERMSRIYLCFGVALFMLLAPVLFLVQGNIFEQGNGIYIVTAIAIAAVVYLVIRLIFLIRSVIKVNNRYYPVLLSDEYLENRQKATRHSFIIISLFVIAVFVIFISAITTASRFYYFEKDYEKAVEIIEYGDHYYVAHSFLYQWSSDLRKKSSTYGYQEYRDYSDLLTLCDMHESHSDNDLKRASDLAHSIWYAPLGSLSNETISREREFMRTVILDYYDQKQADEQAEKALDNRIRRNKPFVGMPESRIDDSVLGKHSFSKSETYKTGKQYYDTKWHELRDELKTRTTYTWKMKEQKIIFTAVCEDGIVVKVEQTEDKGKKNGYRPGKTDYSEHYVDDFSDPEDFYDWYCEDFDSYEDAEDYYYSHGGK